LRIFAITSARARSQHRLEPLGVAHDPRGLVHAIDDPPRTFIVAQEPEQRRCADALPDVISFLFGYPKEKGLVGSEALHAVPALSLRVKVK
jgi:hypothetical protein